MDKQTNKKQKNKIYDEERVEKQKRISFIEKKNGVGILYVMIR